MTGSTKRKPRILLGCLIGFAVLVIVLVLFVVSIPALLSTGLARDLILGALNGRMEGEVSVTDWTLSWTRGFKAEGVAVDDGKGRMSARIESVEIPVPLTALMTDGTRDLGTVNLVRPEIVVTYEPRERTAPKPSRRRRKPGKGRPVSRKRPPVAKKERRVHVPSDIKSRLMIENGSLTVIRRDSADEFTVNDLSLVTDFDGPGSSASFSARMGFEAGGTAEISGGLAGPKKELQVTVSDFDLSQVRALIGDTNSIPDMSGILEGEMDLRSSEQAETRFGGSLRIESLSLAGGRLGEDTPTLDGVRVSLGGSAGRESVSVTNALFESSLGRTRWSWAFGRVDDRWRPQGMSVAMQLDVSAAVANFRDVLSIPGRVGVADGSLSAEGKMTSVNGTNVMYGLVRLSDLELAVDDRALPHVSTFSLSVSAAEGPSSVDIERLKIEAPCYRFESAGRLTDLSGDMDLEVEGELHVDMERTSAFMTVFTGTEFAIEGTRQSRLDIDTPLKDKSLYDLVVGSVLMAGLTDESD